MQRHAPRALGAGYFCGSVPLTLHIINQINWHFYLKKNKKSFYNSSQTSSVSLRTLFLEWIKHVMAALFSHAASIIILSLPYNNNQGQNSIISFKKTKHKLQFNLNDFTIQFQLRASIALIRRLVKSRISAMSTAMPPSTAPTYGKHPHMCTHTPGVYRNTRRWRGR